MYYPIAIEPGDEQNAYGVTVPDLPGCFSAGDTLDEAIKNAHEAIELHLEGLVEDNDAIPMASKAQTHARKSEFDGYIWALVDVDVTQYLGKAEKINVTLPASLITRIDRFVATHPEYKTRSGFLANAALETLAHG